MFSERVRAKRKRLAEEAGVADPQEVDEVQALVEACEGKRVVDELRSGRLRFPRLRKRRRTANVARQRTAWGSSEDDGCLWSVEGFGCVPVDDFYAMEVARTARGGAGAGRGTRRCGGSGDAHGGTTPADMRRWLVNMRRLIRREVATAIGDAPPHMHAPDAPAAADAVAASPPPQAPSPEALGAMPGAVPSPESRTADDPASAAGPAPANAPPQAARDSVPLPPALPLQPARGASSPSSAAATRGGGGREDEGSDIDAAQPPCHDGTASTSTPQRAMLVVSPVRLRQATEAVNARDHPRVSLPAAARSASSERVVRSASALVTWQRGAWGRMATPDTPAASLEEHPCTPVCVGDAQRREMHAPTDRSCGSDGRARCGAAAFRMEPSPEGDASLPVAEGAGGGRGQPTAPSSVEAAWDGLVEIGCVGSTERRGNVGAPASPNTGHAPCSVAAGGQWSAGAGEAMPCVGGSPQAAAGGPAANGDADADAALVRQLDFTGGTTTAQQSRRSDGSASSSAAHGPSAAPVPAACGDGAGPQTPSTDGSLDALSDATSLYEYEDVVPRYERRIRRLYERHQPAMLSGLETIYATYEGFLDQVQRVLEERFGCVRRPIDQARRLEVYYTHVCPGEALSRAEVEGFLRRGAGAVERQFLAVFMATGVREVCLPEVEFPRAAGGGHGEPAGTHSRRAGAVPPLPSRSTSPTGNHAHAGDGDGDGGGGAFNKALALYLQASPSPARRARAADAAYLATLREIFKHDTAAAIIALSEAGDTPDASSA